MMKTFFPFMNNVNKQLKRKKEMNKHSTIKEYNEFEEKKIFMHTLKTF